MIKLFFHFLKKKLTDDQKNVIFVTFATPFWLN